MHYNFMYMYLYIHVPVYLSVICKALASSFSKKECGAIWIINCAAITLCAKTIYIYVHCTLLTLSAHALTLSVCLSVCLLSHISPLERLFILKTLSRTQRATKVKKFALKPLRCRDPALPTLYGHTYRRPFFTHVRYTCTYEHVLDL